MTSALGATKALSLILGSVFLKGYTGIIFLKYVISTQIARAE
jgi:hypothetical protein